MRWTRALLIALLLVPAGGFALSLWSSYFSDDFDVYLEGMGYNSLHPPQNEFSLGSLYDIDENGNLDIVCPTTEAMAKPYTGPEYQNISRATTGSFSAIGDIAERLNAKFGEEYTKHVRLRLQNIRLQKIPATEDGKIQDALIEDKLCSRAVTSRLRLGHYICQVESSFSAVVVYEFVDSLNSSAAMKEPGSGSANNKDKLKSALTANSRMDAKEAESSVLTGDLVFGVKLEPVCISPPNAIFVRSWSKSTVGRVIDFVKYELIEPLFVKDLFGKDAEETVASK